MGEGHQRARHLLTAGLLVSSESRSRFAPPPGQVVLYRSTTRHELQQNTYEQYCTLTDEFTSTACSSVHTVP